MDSLASGSSDGVDGFDGVGGFGRFSEFGEIEALLRIPRLAGVAAGPGGRLVAAIQQADEHGSRLVSSLWELDPEGNRPARRLTFSEKGESTPVFAPDGSLLFCSARPDPEAKAEVDATALWRLPDRGEASVLAATAGNLAIIAVADDGTVLASTSVLAGGSLPDDAERRKARKDTNRGTIWHTGMPIRYWDRELDETSPRLVLIAGDGGVTDLAPDAGTLGLHNASADLAPDGRTVATSWTERVGAAETRTSVVLIDTATAERRVLLAAEEEREFAGPKFSYDGTRLAVTARTFPTPTDTAYSWLEIHPVEGGDPVTVDVGDLTVSQYVWTPDGTLLVAGDLHSSGAVLAVDGRTGDVRTLLDDAVYGSLTVSPDGSAYALRTDMTTPPRPVRLPAITQAGRAGQTGAVELPAPGAIGELPGRLERVRVDVDGVAVGGWLCVPSAASAKAPAAAMLWIHGGPHGSFNAWSWRWCPWLAVARGYAVLLPDPAMSTGYGDAGLNRGWPRRADVVFAECEALFDQVLARPDLDNERTAMLGASFGGFMANWIAGHTDRFDAIVSHAGLWALDQQHRTTDAAAWKMRVHGHEDERTDWYRTYSPHRGLPNIRTPMLISHGNLDYRVPIGEALRLWYDLVAGWDGPPDTMPHRFLQLTNENHWVLTPANSLVWYQTVLAFCDQHLLGADPIPDPLPW